MAKFKFNYSVDSTPKKCLHCSKEFTPRARVAKYCGQKCAQQVNIARQKAKIALNRQNKDLLQEVKESSLQEIHLRTL